MYCKMKDEHHQKKAKQVWKGGREGEGSRDEEREKEGEGEEGELKKDLESVSDEAELDGHDIERAHDTIEKLRDKVQDVVDVLLNLLRRLFVAA